MNGWKHHIPTKKLADNLSLLEKNEGQRIAAKALGLPADIAGQEIEQEMDARIDAALWYIDDFEWICEMEAQAADHADLIDTQECARF